MVAPAKRLVILDRDGVINHDSDDFIKSPEEWHPIDGSLEAIAALNRAGFTVIVATNQSGIGRGLYSRRELTAIHRKMRQALANLGGSIRAIYVCPHHPDDGCDCRKPAPGLLRRIEADFDQPIVGVPFIGDSVRDAAAAEAVGARPILVLTGNGHRAKNEMEHPVECYDDLHAACQKLISESSDP